jgi:flavin reductase (DIM6/NTAB) family NADH-FMN oxidoreductase RutF
VSPVLALSAVADDEQLRRRVLWAMPTVLGVLGSVGPDGTAHLMNVSWVTPVANGPTRLVASVEVGSRSAANLAATGAWALSLLGLERRELGRAFVKPELDWRRDGEGESAQGHRVRRASGGAPYLEESVGVFAGVDARLLAPLDEHALWLLSPREAGAVDALRAGAASARDVVVLSVQHTRMNYGR